MWKRGDIIQFRNDHPNYPGSFVVITTPREWGGIGYIALVEDIPAVREVGSWLAYIRVGFGDGNKVGHTKNVRGEKE